MVDVSSKDDSVRTASAAGKVYVSKEVFIKIKNNEVEK
ncbi:MAG: cyclic pyranopterin monophosphate synthase MoaC, partial [Ignavibacteriaceae bacterium]